MSHDRGHTWTLITLQTQQFMDLGLLNGGSEVPVPVAVDVLGAIHVYNGGNDIAGETGSWTKIEGTDGQAMNATHHDRVLLEDLAVRTLESEGSNHHYRNHTNSKDHTHTGTGYDDNHYYPVHESGIPADHHHQQGAGSHANTSSTQHHHMHHSAQDAYFANGAVRDPNGSSLIAARHKGGAVWFRDFDPSRRRFDSSMNIVSRGEDLKFGYPERKNWHHGLGDAIAFSPYNGEDSILFASSFYSIYVSHDYGATWAEIYRLPHDNQVQESELETETKAPYYMLLVVFFLGLCLGMVRLCAKSTVLPHTASAFWSFHNRYSRNEAGGLDAKDDFVDEDGEWVEHFWAKQNEKARESFPADNGGEDDNSELGQRAVPIDTKLADEFANATCSNVRIYSDSSGFFSTGVATSRSFDSMEDVEII